MQQGIAKIGSTLYFIREFNQFQLNNMHVYLIGISHSLNDYNDVNQLRSQANPMVAVSAEDLIEFTNTVVSQYWQSVEIVAQHLLNSPNGRLDPIAAIDLIQWGKVT